MFYFGKKRRMKKNKVVLVAATMSAGKSSIINALVGREILHSANEATTAKVTRIHIGRFSNHHIVAYKCDGGLLQQINSLSFDLLKQWNCDENIAEIDVSYSIAIHNSAANLNGITIIDTPGANNSVDSTHNDAFIQALKAYPNSTLLYVLNATQLGTTDDAEILKVIRENHSAKNIVFILNKVDMLDGELGECVKKYVQNANGYLESLGFSKPIIVPTMALPALARKKKYSNEVLSRKERHALTNELERFYDTPQLLSRAALLPCRVKRNWQRRMHTVACNKSTKKYKNELRYFSDYCGLQVLKTILNNK